MVVVSAGSFDNQHQNSAAKFAALMSCQRESAREPKKRRFSPTDEAEVAIDWWNLQRQRRKPMLKMSLVEKTD